LNRIMTAQTNGTHATNPITCWGESFTYDTWANLLSIGVSNHPAYNGCTQEGFSQSVTSTNQVSGFCYDGAGNLLAEGSCPGGSSYTYNYDAENHLTSTAGVAYTYDGDGERIEKSNGEIYWYTSGGEILDETDLSGNLTSEYIFFGGARIARRDASGNVFYYLADHLDSSRVMAEIPAGQTTATMCYDADFYPFGGERAYTNSCQQNYKFTGKERDPESGLDNFVARYYGSSIGRFMSADDPFVGWQLNDPQSLNLYAYVQDNPINDVDPTGHNLLPGQCFTAAPQKQVASGCMGGAGPFDISLDCTLDPACGQFWGASAISSAQYGDPLSVGRTNNLQTAENQHVNNIAEKLGMAAVQKAQEKSQQQPTQDKKKSQSQVVVTPSSDQTYPSPTTTGVIHREVVYTPGTLNPDGSFTPDRGDTVTLLERQTGGNSTPIICSPFCSDKGGIDDDIEVANTRSTFRVEQTFEVNDKPASVARAGANGSVSLASKQIVDANAAKITITPVP
jgi:RHS repeat-associated protein